MPASVAVSPRNLFLVSFAALFLEMACIRWLNASVQVLSYFSNVVLVSAFLGLGAGAARGSRSSNLVAFLPWALLVLGAGTAAMSLAHFQVSYTGDVLFAASRFSQDAMLLSVPLSALGAFILNAAVFFTLGHELGRQVAGFRDGLKAYGYDIAGSLAGTVAFAAMSAVESPPWMWALCAMAPLLVLFVGHPRVLLSFGLGMAAVVQGLVLTDDATDWSPYYKVEARPYQATENVDLGFVILVNNVRIQDALAFGEPLARSPLAPWIPYYQLPYRMKTAEKVLILGAGSGNDAVLAKAFGATDIHAVEIDPVIARLGWTQHPMRPYQLPGVTVHVEDARAFASRSTDTFDLVVMSALDSHRQVGGTGSIRLESFVYTSESFQAVRKLLRPGGVFVVHLASSRPWMGPRAFASLQEAFGQAPVVFGTRDAAFGDLAYVVGNNAALPTDAALAAQGVYRVPPPSLDGVRPARDDWPFLYLESNAIPPVNAAVCVVMLLLAVLATGGRGRGSRRQRAHFFLLGAGFMLLETMSITRMALLVGTSWYVSAFVVAAVLVAIFATNALSAAGFGVPRRPAYALLLLSLLLCWWAPVQPLMEMALPARVAAGGLLIALPVAWASFIFSGSFRTVADRGAALGANLLGVVLGGSLEYLGNIVGMSALYLVAAALYALSWLVADEAQPAAAAE
jgi:SAM-dependent methyltransferase